MDNLSIAMDEKTSRIKFSRLVKNENSAKKFLLDYMILYFVSGFVLMMLKLPAERLKAASILADTIVDSENISSDLIPYIAMESQTNIDNILKCLTKATFK